MTQAKKSKYTPLYYLSSLGAGGIALAFWKFGDITSQNALTLAGQIFFWALSLVLFLVNLPLWVRALHASYDRFFGVDIPVDGRSRESLAGEHPVVSTGWMAMPAAFVMLLNTSFAIFPSLLNLSAKQLAPYGFAVWMLSFVIALILGGQILLNTFTATASLREFHFGLFLQPLVLGLHAIPAVTMSGMLPEPWGDMSLLLGLTAFGIGGVIGALALIFIFERFMTYGLPEPSVAPTSLLMMPSITVYTLFVLKTMHLLVHHYKVHIDHVWFVLVSLMGIGVMGAAATLGLIVLYAYFRHKVPFGPGWWSFVCPFVALSVLSSVTYQMAGKHGLFLISAALALVVVTFIYLYVSFKTIDVLKKG